MLYIYYGEDSFSVHEAVSSLKESVGPEELRDVNVTSLDSAKTSFDEMAALCNTVPFMADKRLVVLDGVLSRFERPRGVSAASEAEAGACSEATQPVAELVVPSIPGIDEQSASES